MRQVNVKIDDRLASVLDRIASEKGIPPTELIRLMIAEMGEAHDAGRLPFAREEGPRLDISLSLLVNQLREAVVELDRSQRENQKLTKRYLDQWNGSEEAYGIANERLSDQLNNRFQNGLQPFRDEVETVSGHVEVLPEYLLSGLGDHLSRIDKQLALNNQLAAQPRAANYLSLSHSKRVSLGLLVATFVLVFAFGFFAGAYTMDTNQHVISTASKGQRQ